MGKSKFDNFKLDSPGIRQIMKSGEIAAMTRRVAESIANKVRAQHPDAEIKVDSYVTDRAAASVTINDVRGRLWQVRDGVLTRAAASEGIEVRAK